MIMTVSGSGISNPITAIFTDPYRAIAIGSAVFFFGSIHRVYLFRENILSDPKNIKYIKRMLPASILGAFVGGVLISNLNIKLVVILVAVSSIFLIVKTIKSLFTTKKTISKDSIKNDVLVAIITGFFQGSGMPGVDMRNNYLRTVISEVSVRAVSSVVCISNFFVVFVVIFFHKKMLVTDLYFVISIIPMLIIAQIYGKKILIKLADRTAKLISVSMSMVGVLLLIYKYLL